MSAMITVNSIKYNLKGASLELDTGETLRLDTGVALELKLSSGCEVDTLQYNLIKEESERFEAFEKALGYLSIRNRSEKEVSRYLAKKGFSELTSAEIIEKLTELGYINDRNFAERFVDYQKRRKPVGRRYLENELYKKGISRKIIQKTMKKSLNEEEEVEAAVSAARKKHSSLAKKKNPAAALYSFLAQRGFDSDIIGRAVNILKSEGYEFD